MNDRRPRNEWLVPSRCRTLSDSQLGHALMIKKPVTPMRNWMVSRKRVSVPMKACTVYTWERVGGAADVRQLSGGYPAVARRLPGGCQVVAR